MIFVKASQSKKFNEFFKTHKKKDDLADSFLQGLWFLEKENEKLK